MADFTNFKKWAGTDFEAYILPIIPAGATLKPESKLKPEMLGKIPGRYSPDVRAWAGLYQWQLHRGTARSLAIFESWQLDAGPVACGINTRNFPCFDIDCNDPAIADQVENIIALEIGASPVVRLRHGSARRTLMYERDQRTAPITKHRRIFQDEQGQTHMVELLADGEQTVIEGPHAKGAMHYWRSGDPIENREWLKNKLITGDDIVRAMNALSTWIDATPGIEMVKAAGSSGASGSASAVKITDLTSPHVARDRNVLVTCMRAIDLDDERIDYDTFISLLRALCAAVNGDIEFFTEQVWPWVCTQKIARGAGPRSEDRGIEWLETRWRSFTDSQLGAEFIYTWQQPSTVWPA